MKEGPSFPARLKDRHQPMGGRNDPPRPAKAVHFYHHHPVSSGVDTPRRRGGDGANVALCLSGGGIRAALFHLGALRRLNELGILRKVDTIVSVSGGSILAAFLAKFIRDTNEWPVAPGDWQERISGPFQRLASRDLRTWALVSKYWNVGVAGHRVRILERTYDRYLTGGMRLADLPVRPEFRFCASDLHLGVPWIFSKEKVGNSLRGYLDPRQRGQGSAWTLARAVAASSCFPPVFGPMRVDLRGLGRTPGSDAEATALGEALLSDGGVIDNFGVETVRWTHSWIIVSDGGAPLRFEVEARVLPGLQLALAASQHQSIDLRKRWLIDQFFVEARRRRFAQKLEQAGASSILDENDHASDGPKGTYLGISSSADGFGSSFGYSRDLAERSISRIRTDLTLLIHSNCRDERRM
jgi:predicted acylesterase/phospholipase RssA